MQIASPAGDHEAAQSAGYLDSVGRICHLSHYCCLCGWKEICVFCPTVCTRLGSGSLPKQVSQLPFPPTVAETMVQLQSNALMLMTNTPVHPKGKKTILIGLDLFGGMVWSLRRMEGGNGAAYRQYAEL